MATFPGFPDRTLDVLGALPGWTRDDYAARKAEVAEQVLDPAKAFVEALLDDVRERISPALDGSPKVNGSLSPLNNDLRFSPDQDPYRDYLLVWLWEGDSKKSAPKLAVRLHPEGVGFASGTGFDGPRLDRWRAAVDADATGGPFAEAVDAVVKQNDAEVVGAELKRVPKPFAADHPRGDLLRHKMIQVRWAEPVPASFHSARFVSWCGTRLARLADVHRFLVEHVG